MNRLIPSSRVPAFVLAVGYLASAAPAAAQATGGSGGQSDNQRNVSFADFSASIGFSGNPLLRSGNRSSAFGRVSFLGFHSWNSERGSTSLLAFVENTTYLQGGYGSKQIFRVDARADRALSETVRVFGNFDVRGDIAGQLTNRFTAPPSVILPPDTLPPPDTVPQVINLSGRQYFVNGNVGASIVTSALSSVSVSAGASHAFFTGGNNIADYSTYQGSLGYSHQLSQRTSVGATVSVQRQDFRGSDYSDVVNTAATVRTQLAQDINASASLGILAVYVHRAGESDHSYSPSFSGSICKAGERTQFCANVSRTAQAPLSVGVAQNARNAAVTTNFGFNYSRQLSRDESVRALVTAARSSQVSVVDEERLRTTYVTGLLGYDRKIGNRLFAGVSVGARRVFQTGPDPRMDFNGSLSLRYRLGNLR